MDMPPKGVTVIGAANMDINGFSRDPLNMADSNPGRVEYCPGGVGRNIAENLLRLGAKVRLISVIGDDPGGQLIRSSSGVMGLDIEHSLFIPGLSSSVYMAILDSNGEMKLALSDMSALERMTEGHLESKADIIAGSGVVVLDTGLQAGMIRFILDRFGSSREPGPLFFLDPVSARKSAKVKGLTGRFHTLKLSRMEAAYLSGVAIPPPEDEGLYPALKQSLEDAASFFMGEGSSRVFITLGKGGIFFASGEKRFFTPVHYVKPVNTSGGGDSFMAGMIYGTLRGWEPEKIAAFSAAMGAITVRSGTTVSGEMSLSLVEETVKAFGKENRSNR
ncbi:MAG: PfkB family carbohydrate kinase [Treponema sp.]|jgi:pseudouridine kinase|nr:PfkB family carbohydrate kinase [Treponema sp.]